MRRFFMAPLAPQLLSVLRIVTAFLYLLHGGQKLFGWFGGVDGQGATVELMSRYGAAGVIELVGGTLVLVGLLTRPVAFVLAGEMAFAYFLAHLPRAFWPIQNGGEVVVMFCFVFLYLSAAGAGPWSIDALRERGSPDA